MFLGNGMEIGGGAELDIGKMYYAMNCNVLMVSYRGYSLSEGYPSEKGRHIDKYTNIGLSSEIMSFLPNFAMFPIVVYGLSLGGAVAIDLTSRNSSQIAALIVENTFTSLPDIVHGGALDQVVPPRHMEQLFELALLRGRDANSTIKAADDVNPLILSVFESFPSGSHANTGNQWSYREAVAHFLERDDIQKSNKSTTEQSSQL
ncbi:hypothetical protein AMATHDRAFT_5930 [Amanita thiersii Skay4041]|uniref:Serine aminopeptidase S33 domain-containing protein n=1 Tax=Amanita thiersii Skay4041 TaxID=703135 RepID=A0A2A9NKU5_9AGAR|nr:hypothetical protein AMATHDRAFT_5930 [Amanita thiersii Skay4041]